MVLEHRPEPLEIVRLDIIDEEQAMRIADIDHRRRMQHRRRRSARSAARSAACRGTPRPAGSRPSAKRGAPMSTVTLLSLFTTAPITPLSVSMLTSAALRSAATSAATQRVALPQAPTSPPSAFQMRMNTSALRDGSSTISWSQPIALFAVGDGAHRVRRREQARAAAHRARRNRCRARSSCGRVSKEPASEPYCFAAPI